MNKDNTLVIMAGIVVLAIIVVCGVYFITNSEDVDADLDGIDMTGDWYAVSIEIYDENGDYNKYTTKNAEIVIYDFFVKEHSKPMISGNVGVKNFTGSVVSGVITAESATYSTYYSDNEIYSYESDYFVIEGRLINENVLSLTIIELGYAATYDRESRVWSYEPESVKRVITGTFTQDRSYENMVKTVDVLGEWSCESAFRMWADGSADLFKGNIKITEQKGALFKGTMEQEVAGVQQTKDILGAFTSEKSGDYNMAYIADDTGFVWTSLISKDAMILQAQDISETGESKGEVVTIERIYTKDGSSVPEVKAPMDLVGTEWTSNRSNYIGQTTEGKERGSYSFSFEKQEGSMVSGTMTYNDWWGIIDYTFVGYIYGNSEVIIDLCTAYKEYWGDNVYSYEMWGTIVFQDDDTMYYTVHDGWMSQSSVFTKVTDDVESYNITGHWHKVRIEGINAAGNRTTSINNLTYLHVYGFEENMFYGYFDGRYVTGSYVDNVLTMRCDVDKGYMMFTGRLLDEVTLISVVTFYDSETNNTSVWRAEYTSDPVDYYYSSPESESISPVWEILSGRSFNADGPTDLAGSVLTIDRYYRDVFRGTMVQQVGDESVTKNIKGVMSQRVVDSEGNEILYGYIIDSSGFVWSFIIEDERLYMYCTIIGETSATMGEPVAVERIYGKGADGNLVDRELINVEGTWKASTIYRMNEFGEVKTYSEDYKLVIGDKGQDKALFYGSSTGFVDGTFVGYVAGHRVNILSDYGEGADSKDSGYGIMSEDGSEIYLVEYYDMDGVCYTQICTLVKQ